MSMFYSKATGGFYSDDFHDTMPDDCVPLTDEAYALLMDGLGSGKVIAATEDGTPELAAPAVQTPSVQQQIAALQAQQTADLVRSCLLGNTVGIAALRAIDDKIASLRAQAVK